MRDYIPVHRYTFSWVHDTRCRWQEVRDYILERRDAIRGKDLSQEELLEGPAAAAGSKGFS